MIISIAKWCNKYLNPFLYGLLFLLFGAAIYAYYSFIPSFIMVAILLIITVFDRTPYNKDRQARRMYISIASILSITIFNLICFSFMPWEFGVISNSILLVPFSVILYRNFSNLNLEKLYEQDPEAMIEEKKKNTEFIKYAAFTLMGLWMLLLVSLITYISGKTGEIWLLIFLPILLFAVYFTMKQIILSVIFKEWIGIKIWRLIFNIACIFGMVAIAFLLSNDGAWGSDHIEFDLFPIFGMIVLFYFPFKTGHSVSRKLHHPEKRK